VIRVYDWDGTPGDDFRVYYQEQLGTYVVPQTVYYSGTTVPSKLGSPDSGLTNTQNWATHGIAIGGAITPCTTTRSGIKGYVCSLP
jgi:hypothetical protein